jgi:hypothetical protein
MFYEIFREGAAHNARTANRAATQHPRQVQLARLRGKI